MDPIRVIRARTAVLAVDNIDTDQIIPARFLKVTGRSGLGRHLFSDWRYDPSGRPRPEFVLNRAEAAGAAILVAGDNFGCGSSREHAAWALVDAGFRAVVSTTVASIFRGNALKNGLLPIVVPAGFHARLVAAPGGEVTIDLERLIIQAQDGVATDFPIEPFARHCLLEGIDEMSFLLRHEEAITAFERRRDEPV